MTPAVMSDQFSSIDSVAQQMPNSNELFDLLPMDQVRAVTKSDIELESDGNKEVYSVLENAYHELSKMVDVPPRYVFSLPDDMFLNNINYGFTHERDAYKGLKAVLRKSTREITSFTDRRWNVLSSGEVLKAAASGIKDAQVHQWAIRGDGDVDFSLTAPQLRTDMQMGDVQFFSVGFRYSDLGRFIPEAHSQGNRVVCGNVMRSPYGIDGRHFKIFEQDHDTIRERFAEAARRGVEYIDTIMVPKIRETLNQRIGDMDKYIQTLGREYGVPERVRTLIYAALQIGERDGAGNHSMYAVTNALTRAANSGECPESWKDRLQWLAGSLTVEDFSLHCNTCFSKIG